jgi:hypothetical protein
MAGDDGAGHQDAFDRLGARGQAGRKQQRRNSQGERQSEEKSNAGPHIQYKCTATTWAIAESTSM